MVLPLIVFEILLAVALILFLFGGSRQSLNAGFIFLLLSGLFIIITGMLLSQGGLELNTVSEFPNNPDGSTAVTYDIALSDFGSPIWALSQLFIFGGVGMILISFVLSVRQKRQLIRKQQQVNIF